MFDKAPSYEVLSPDPFNGAPALAHLCRSFVTPTDHFFTRNHGAVPEVDSTSFRLTVDGDVARPLILGLDDVRHAFPRQTILATLQCAGNRRRELMSLAPLPGEVPWDASALSTAEWGGVPLRAVLEAAGVGRVVSGHVAFEGLDQIEKEGDSFRFGGSIPLEKAMSEEVLLAYEMNGCQLPAAHGFPLRAVVPGYIGARSVKWLSRITVQQHSSTNYYQRRAYKLFPPHVRAETAEWDATPELGELEINAVIAGIESGGEAGSLRAHGYAIAGGGRGIESVELSVDGGATWQRAELLDTAQPWAWRLWEVRLGPLTGVKLLVVRARDTAGNMQPPDARALWNFKGYMNNAWHRVPV